MRGGKGEKESGRGGTEKEREGGREREEGRVDREREGGKEEERERRGDRENWFSRYQVILWSAVKKTRLVTHSTYQRLFPFFKALVPSQGGSREDAAYRCYRRCSGEEALIKRKQKHRRLAVSQDYFLHREGRQVNSKAHAHYLMKLHHQFGPTVQPQCQNPSCENQCMPFASRCSRRILNTSCICDIMCVCERERHCVCVCVCVCVHLCLCPLLSHGAYVHV